MRQFIIGVPAAVFVLQRLPRAVEFDSYVAMGFLRDGEIIAGVIYSRWQPRSRDMQLTFASNGPGWATRGVLRAIFDYPFRQSNCARVTAITAEGNHKARRLLTGVGFIHEGTHPHGFDGVEAALSYGMTRAACRWLPDVSRETMNHGVADGQGQQLTAAAA